MSLSEDGVGGELSLEELARRITSGAVRLAAATAAWLVLVAEFDRREGWGAVGIRSCAQWLAWQCGLSPGAAREHVRVARALTALPATTAAFAAGRLSYAKVRALTRVAEPDTEPALLELAYELTASQLERVVREWRRSDAVDDATVPAKQRFDHWWDDDGMLHVRLCLAAEEGAAFLAGVDSVAERSARRERAAVKQDAAGVPDGEKCDEDDDVANARDRSTARRCAAVAQLVSAAAEADRRAGDPPRREVVVHADAAVLAEDAAAGRAHIEGGPALHPAQVRRMLCEATVVTMLERGREPLAVGRARRFATRAQRRALYRRDGGCARLGCAETRIERLHAHHMRHWLHGGPTDVANMVLLCDVDHGLAHDLDLIMSRRDGRLVITAPDGRWVWGTADAAFTRGWRASRPGHTTRCSPASTPWTPPSAAARRQRLCRRHHRPPTPLLRPRARRHRPRRSPGCSSPTGNRTCPTRCTSTASRWTWPTWSASCSVTATSNAAWPPRTPAAPGGWSPWLDWGPTGRSRGNADECRTVTVHAPESEKR
ncbi:HNH endonuclease [Geodermatophilus obscurus]|uniref:HNH endonuclease n=1 Tax=Geodermatophilus obscurus TaxID=1861 RepID=A0A1M7TWS4_9ACTN|nr:HNH endonuclease signature motif containing protein [Geodermatophilus obscurus]SHN75063.1 HNH endonuclease [Geodermatophilus obscurus]